MSIKGGARLVAAGILLSRMFGLVRQKVMAHFLGADDAADVLASAFRIPNFLQNLFGEGVLSASFIPVYSKLLAEGKRDEAGRVAGAVATLLALTTTVLVLLGVVGASVLVDVITPGFSGAKREMAVHLVRLIFPGVGLLVLSAWCLGVLNSHRRFFLSYVSPVLWNLAMIVAMLWWGPRETPEQLVVTAAWASVLGSLLQFLVQVPTVLRLDRALRFAPDASSPLVRTVAKRFGTVVVGRGVVQVSGFVDTAIASLVGVGSVATLNYAQALSMLPVSLFGMSISAAELPAMSGEVGTADEVASALRTRLDRGLGRIAYFVIPSAAAFLLLGGEIASGLYQGGAFTAESAQWVWAALAGAAVGLLAGTMGRLYSSASYALGDTTSPLRYALVRVSFGAVVGWASALLLPGLLGVDARWGIAALTASSGVAAWIEFLLLRGAVTRRVGATGVPVVRIAALWLCALLPAAAAFALSRQLPTWTAWLRAGAVLSLFGVGYLLLTRLARLDDARRT
ncbi:MAG: murein biosynthesis integral membrane protein MurJ [Gemmatimonadaceae bacterium]|nr:murein biosynthesis integral membrane protein MurJ [Gemmatimonadaceae bacterium]